MNIGGSCVARAVGRTLGLSWTIPQSRLTWSASTPPSHAACAGPWGSEAVCQAWSWCDEYLLGTTSLRILTQSI